MPPGLQDFPFTAMGSPGLIRVDGVPPELATPAAQAMMAEIARIEARYSRYRPDSELSRLNRIAAAGGTAILDNEAAALVDYAFACHRKSGGLFDVTAGILRRAWDFTASRPPAAQSVATLLPLVGLGKLAWTPPALTFRVPGMELDFGGIGKEYAVDRAAEIALAHGLGHVLVDLGGDIRAIGPRADGAPWPIGIRHPREPERLAARLPLCRGAVATSGDYERFIEADGRRYCHILDPRTGWPAEGMSAVTVLADSCMVAGSVATIAMLRGREGAAWLGGLGLPFLWLDAEGTQGEYALPSFGGPTPGC